MQRPNHIVRSTVGRAVRAKGFARFRRDKSVLIHERQIVCGDVADVQAFPQGHSSGGELSHAGLSPLQSLGRQ